MRNEGGGFAAFIPHSTFLPPSFGRRCPEGGGSWLSMRYFTRGDANPASLRSPAPSRGRGENDP